MASANVELVRSIFAAWERGDYSSAEWAHANIELIRPDGPEPGTWTGLTGLASGARANLDPWEDFRVEAEDYRELDAERVLVLVRFSGRGKKSGLELDEIRTKGAEVFHVRGDEVTRIVRYFDRDRALADLGLARERDAVDLESGGSPG